MISKILPSIFKVFLLSVLITGFSESIFSQTVSIVANPGYSGNAVIGGDTYHASECIYQASEIGTGNFESVSTAMNRIAFGLNAISTATLPVAVSNYQIYIKSVPAATTTFVTGTYSLTGYTLVFSGTLNITTVGWNTVDLTTPFYRNPGENIQVLVIRNNGAAITGTSFDCSVGSTANSADLTTRRYNSTVMPVAGSSSLASSTFRFAIQFIKTVSADVKPINLIQPSASCFAAPQSVTVSIQNAGSSTIAAGAVQVAFTVSGANTATINQNSGIAIPAGGSQDIVFNGINLPTVGNNNIQAVVNLTGDADVTNDTIRSTLSTLGILNTYPALEDATVLTGFANLKVLSGTRQLWALSTGKYKNADLTDSLAPKAGNNFFYFDSWSGASSIGVSNILFSRCFAIPSGQVAAYYDTKFWMSHDNSYATDLDSMYFSVSTDKGVTWTRLAGYQRYDATFLVPGWKEETVNLAPYAGQTIQLAFEGVSKYGNIIGLDEITVLAGSTLPITLSNFSGIRSNGKNILNWETATEVNSKGFELERSANGIEFVSIGSIVSKAANGFSSSALSYSFADINTLKGNNYYRLRQLDKDSRATYSQTILLKAIASSKTEISNIYPNPAKEKLNVVIAAAGSENVSIVITDLAGRVIALQNFAAIQGDNNIQFNTSAFAKGTYLLKIQSADKTAVSVQKFVKQ